MEGVGSQGVSISIRIDKVVGQGSDRRVGPIGNQQTPTRTTQYSQARKSWDRGRSDR